MEPAWKTARRRPGPSRWNPPNVKTFVPGIPPTLPPTDDADLLDALTLRVRLDEVQYLMTTGKIDLQDPHVRRSPEPTPIYDAKVSAEVCEEGAFLNFLFRQGVRVNTKEKVASERLAAERQALVQAALKINPHFVPPSDYRQVAQQLQLRINIPFKEYPDYNFIGLIIGPRGLTQKQMEKDTGCKIAIRGKGSVKDGKQTSASNTDDPLHVMITAPDLVSLRKAEGLVRKLVTPVEENQNEHKRAQLRKLAEINGTLMGHEEAYAASASGGGSASRRAAAAVCRNCGSSSHATYDCQQRGDRVGVPSMTVRELMQREYAAFCRAVGEQEPDITASNEAEAEQAMSSFYSELGK
jgi:splicing factor 1